jgi:hypothetical protein
VDKSRIAWLVTLVLLMVAALGLTLVAAKLILDGIGMSFYIEPSNEAFEAAQVGLHKVQLAYLVFGGLAAVALVLNLHHWWVGAGLAAPSLIAVVLGLLVSWYGSAVIALIGVPLAFFAAGGEFVWALLMLVRAMRRTSPLLQTD